MSIIDKIKNNPKLKALAILLLQPKNEHRPRWWVKWFWNPWIHKRGKNSIIRRRTRMDVMPYNQFNIGNSTVIEDFATVNNIVGDVIIGDRVLIGISSVIIGPVTLGNDIMLAQHVVISGLNHIYQDINKPINQQKVSTKPVVLEDEVWVGANVVITAGVTIGKHAIIAAGSVVVKDVPPYSIVAGNPATLKKQYNFETNTWDKVLHDIKNL